MELKVLVLMNSNIKQAFDCGEDREKIRIIKMYL